MKPSGMGRLLSWRSAALAGCAAALAVASATRGSEPLAAPGPGDASRGLRAFEACGTCHEVAAHAGSTVGPNLFGVVGRKIGSLPGFDYSEALRALPGAWDPAALDRFLASPEGVAPGTRMGVDGVADARQRADLVAYLATLRPGAAAPPTPAPDFGPGWPAGPGQVEAGRLCGACHSLAIVKQQRLSRAAWDRLLTWMVTEQGMAEPTPEQRALMLEYLAAHFGSPR
ncbi:MAG: c-type cytochrome [Anaeromyxobacteraceae bacterium]|nr:c-type cytochrome [Anaeromyxobacteraceae bacterium]